MKIYEVRSSDICGQVEMERIRNVYQGDEQQSGMKFVLCCAKSGKRYIGAFGTIGSFQLMLK